MTNRILDGLKWVAQNHRTGHDLAEDFYPEAQRKMRDWMSKVESYVGDYPLQALGAALATGILLGWMVKRK